MLRRSRYIYNYKGLITNDPFFIVAIYNNQFYTYFNDLIIFIMFIRLEAILCLTIDDQHNV